MLSNTSCSAECNASDVLFIRRRRARSEQRFHSRASFFPSNPYQSPRLDSCTDVHADSQQSPGPACVLLLVSLWPPFAGQCHDVSEVLCVNMLLDGFSAPPCGADGRSVLAVHCQTRIVMETRSFRPHLCFFFKLECAYRQFSKRAKGVDLEALVVPR